MQSMPKCLAHAALQLFLCFPFFFYFFCCYTEVETHKKMLPLKWKVEKQTKKTICAFRKSQRKAAHRRDPAQPATPATPMPVRLMLNENASNALPDRRPRRPRNAHVTVKNTAAHPHFNAYSLCIYVYTYNCTYAYRRLLSY